MLKSVPYYNRITEFRLSLITIIMELIDMTRYLAYLLISILTFSSVCCAVAERETGAEDTHKQTPIENEDKIDLDDLDIDGIDDSVPVKKNTKTEQKENVTVVNDAETVLSANVKTEDLPASEDVPAPDSAVPLPENNKIKQNKESDKKGTQEQNNGQETDTEKQSKDPELAAYEQACSSSFTVTGSPYEKASCTITGSMLNIELTPMPIFTDNIRNANISSIDQSMCSIFSSLLPQISIINYTFLDSSGNIINQHVIDKNNCRQQ